MPEGDTVWLHAKKLNDALAGSIITNSDFRLPQLATTDLSGSTVCEVVSRGKHLLIRINTPGSGDWTLRSHLRMDGTWRIFGAGQRWSGRPAHTIRVVLATAGVTAVGFHLHDVALVPRDHEEELVGHLGPDLLGPDWDPAEAVRRLAADPDRPVGEAVLDQRCLAGLGTVWRAELLFLRGVNPWTPVRDVELPALVGLAHRLLMANRGRWAQVTTGNTRRGQEHYVYGRAGEPCRRCRTRIRRGEQGPVTQERVTFWCPSCQPEINRS
jgi:endonuclease-8